ncbi:MAG: hypothetical protein IT340_20150 [Chloroflexi bacterium]|nr:hypothetical protein [Chloroflexota bacterium]
MRLIVAGSRGVTDYNVVERCIRNSGYLSRLDAGSREDTLPADAPPWPEGKIVDEVIVGEARGVATCAINWAVEHWCPWTLMPANWDAHGKRAGYLRNEQMAGDGDALVAVWDGRSRGTRHMIDAMRRRGKPVAVWRVAGGEEERLDDRTL